MKTPKIIIIWLCMALAGCSLLKLKKTEVKSPEVTVAPSGAVAVSGDAKIPASVDTTRTESITPIPKGSTIVLDEKLGTTTITVSKDSQMASNRTETAVKGPSAFEPAKGPTASEEASAKADFWTILGYRIGVFIGVAAAIYGLVEQWKLVMIGGGCVAAACLFGLFQQSHPVLLAVIGIGIALAFAGPYLYHKEVKPLLPESK